MSKENCGMPRESGGNIIELLERSEESQPPEENAYQLPEPEECDTNDVVYENTYIMHGEDTYELPIESGANSVLHENTRRLPVESEANAVRYENTSELHVESEANTVVYENTSLLPVYSEPNAVVFENVPLENVELTEGNKEPETSQRCLPCNKLELIIFKLLLIGLSATFAVFTYLMEQGLSPITSGNLRSYNYALLIVSSIAMVLHLAELIISFVVTSYEHDFSLALSICFGFVCCLATLAFSTGFIIMEMIYHAKPVLKEFGVERTVLLFSAIIAFVIQIVSCGYSFDKKVTVNITNDGESVKDGIYDECESMNAQSSENQQSLERVSTKEKQSTLQKFSKKKCIAKVETISSDPSHANDLSKIDIITFPIDRELDPSFLRPEVGQRRIITPRYFIEAQTIENPDEPRGAAANINGAYPRISVTRAINNRTLFNKTMELLLNIYSMKNKAPVRTEASALEITRQILEQTTGSSSLLDPLPPIEEEISSNMPYGCEISSQSPEAIENPRILESNLPEYIGVISNEGYSFVVGQKEEDGYSEIGNIERCRLIEFEKEEPVYEEVDETLLLNQDYVDGATSLQNPKKDVSKKRCDVLTYPPKPPPMRPLDHQRAQQQLNPSPILCTNEDSDNYDTVIIATPTESESGYSSTSTINRIVIPDGQNVSVGHYFTSAAQSAQNNPHNISSYNMRDASTQSDLYAVPQDNVNIMNQESTSSDSSLTSDFGSLNISSTLETPETRSMVSTDQNSPSASGSRTRGDDSLQDLPCSSLRGENMHSHDFSSRDSRKQNPLSPLDLLGSTFSGQNRPSPLDLAGIHLSEQTRHLPTDLGSSPLGGESPLGDFPGRQMREHYVHSPDRFMQGSSFRRQSPISANDFPGGPSNELTQSPLRGRSPLSAHDNTFPRMGQSPRPTSPQNKYPYSVTRRYMPPTYLRDNPLSEQNTISANEFSGSPAKGGISPTLHNLPPSSLRRESPISPHDFRGSPLRGQSPISPRDFRGSPLRGQSPISPRDFQGSTLRGQSFFSPRDFQVSTLRGQSPISPHDFPISHLSRRSPTSPRDLPGSPLSRRSPISPRDFPGSPLSRRSPISPHDFPSSPISPHDFPGSPLSRRSTNSPRDFPGSPLSRRSPISPREIPGNTSRESSPISPLSLLSSRLMGENPHASPCRAITFSSSTNSPPQHNKPDTQVAIEMTEVSSNKVEEEDVNPNEIDKSFYKTGAIPKRRQRRN